MTPTQRTVLFWDTWRKRGNPYRVDQAETAPNVNEYAVELAVHGRTLRERRMTTAYRDLWKFA